MNNSHTISGLIAKKSEIAGQIDFYQAEMKKLKEDLGHIDATIKILDPTIDLRTIKAKKVYKQNKYFHDGEANTLILDIMRKARKPMSTTEIALKLMETKKIDLEDKEALVYMQKIVSMTLRKQERRNIVEITGKADGKTLIWQIKGLVPISR